MLNASVIVRLTEQNEIHSEGGVIHDADNIVGQHVELNENYNNDTDMYVITTGYEGYGRMASYEVAAEFVESVEEL